MLILVIAIVAAVLCIVSLIVGPRLKDSSGAAFKACVAVSGITLVLAVVCGFISYTTFNMGKLDDIQQVTIDDTYDLVLPPPDAQMHIGVVETSPGVWCYSVPIVNPATGQAEDRFPPVDLTVFINPGDDGRCYMEWTEKYAMYQGQDYHSVKDVKFGYRNDDEMLYRISQCIESPRCLVVVPLGTVIDEVPQTQPVADQQMQQPIQ